MQASLSVWLVWRAQPVFYLLQTYVSINLWQKGWIPEQTEEVLNIWCSKSVNKCTSTLLPLKTLPLFFIDVAYGSGLHHPSHRWGISLRPPISRQSVRIPLWIHQSAVTDQVAVLSGCFCKCIDNVVHKQNKSVLFSLCHAKIHLK